MSREKPSLQPQNFRERLALWILDLPRITRILVALVLALTVAFAVSPIVDGIYLHFFYSDQTRILPSIVTAVFGLGMYVAGWILIVGTVGEDVRAENKRLALAVMIYLAVGLLAIITVSAWLTRLVTVGTATFS